MKALGKDIEIKGALIRIGRLKAEHFDTIADPAAMLEDLRSAERRIDVFTFVEKLVNTWPLYEYQSEWDNLAALRVTTFEHWWTKEINGKTRNMVRRAEKAGVSVREAAFDDAFVQGISNVYNESEMRQGKRFTHYRKDLETVRMENGTFLDRAVFIGAYLGEDLIGFAKVVADETGRQAGLMQIVSMIKHRDKAATNALIAQAVRSCAERGVGHLFYGHYSYGKKQHDTLSEFKQHNGFQQVNVRRYYVSLTLKGQVALRLGLHHGRLIDHVPESLQSRLRNIRNLRNRWKLAATQR